jgi:hypothetical protein
MAFQDLLRCTHARAGSACSASTSYRGAKRRSVYLHSALSQQRHRESFTLPREDHAMSSNNPAPAQRPPGNDQAAPGLLWYRPGALGIMILLLLLLVPALWNGFPLIFADTGGYLARPFEGTLELGRSATYGAFLAAGMPFDFWPIVIVQAAITIWVILLTLRVVSPDLRTGYALVIVVALAVVTSLPWYVSQLMPDIFVLLAAVALHLLAFRTERLTRIEIATLAAVIAFAIASHMSALALVTAQLAVFAVLKLVARPLALPSPRLAPAALAIVAGLALALTVNAAVAGKARLTPGGSTFLFARLVQDGIAKRYLDDHCRHQSLRLCAVRNELTISAEDWLWWGDSPLHRLGGWQSLEAEANHIIIETLRLYPGAHLAAAIRNTALQMVTLATGEGINSTHNWHAEDVLEDLAPHTMPRFRSAEQQRDGFDFAVINLVQVPAALIATLLLPAVVIALHRRRPQAAAFALSALIVLLVNAAICGNFSNPNARYQSRLAPLATFALLVAAAGIHRGDMRRRPRPATPPAVPDPRAA